MTGSSEAWDGLRAQRVSMPDHVVSRAFAHETVLLNVSSGKYHGISTIGAVFLEVLLEVPRIEAARNRLAERYSQPVETIQADLTAFVQEMSDQGLVELSPASG